MINERTAPEDGSPTSLSKSLQHGCVDGHPVLGDIFARVVRFREALEDGEGDLALQLADGLEVDLATALERLA